METFALGITLGLLVGVIAEWCIHGRAADRRAERYAMQMSDADFRAARADEHERRAIARIEALTAENERLTAELDEVLGRGTPDAPESLTLEEFSERYLSNIYRTSAIPAEGWYDAKTATFHLSGKPPETDHCSIHAAYHDPDTCVLDCFYEPGDGNPARSEKVVVSHALGRWLSRRLGVTPAPEAPDA
jgi:hypothetical protein